MTIIDRLLKRPTRAELIERAETAERVAGATAQELVAERRNVETVSKDPTGRGVIARLLKNIDPYDDICRMGPNGCEAHFNERDCSVAWAKSYRGGFITSSPGAASLQLMLATVSDSFPVLIEALEEYADRHEPDGAQDGDTGVVGRRHARRARELAHAARGGPKP